MISSSFNFRFRGKADVQSRASKNGLPTDNLCEIAARSMRGRESGSISEIGKNRKRPETVGISGAGSAAPELNIKPIILK